MRGNYILSTLIGIVSVFCFLYSCNQEKQENMSELYMLIGTYTSPNSDGIYVYKLNSQTGESSLVSTTKMENPSYLTFSPNGEILYAVSESDNLENDGISSFQFDRSSGKLLPLDSILTEGEAPCYIMNSFDSKWVLTANYNGGSLSMVKVNSFGMFEDAVHVVQFQGEGPNKERQQKSHLHSIYPSPDSLYLFANDLGADKIYRMDYREDLDNTSIFEIPLKPGSGPRHTVFHPNGKWAYTITELSGEVIAFNYADGVLEEFQTVLADTLGAQGSADIQITPNGKYLYASNRLQGDGIAIFLIDQTNGKLTKIGYQETGSHPRNLAITPNGKFILAACRDENKVEVYQIDNKTGLLYFTNSVSVNQPVCVKFTSLSGK